MDLSYDPPETFRHAADRLHELVAKEVGADDFGPTDYLSGQALPAGAGLRPPLS